MKRFLTSTASFALALPLFMGAVLTAAPAAAQQRANPERVHNLPFLRGNRSPQHLASRIAENLSKPGQSDGTHIIDPAQCRKDGSCASPLNYLVSLQTSRPGLTLTGMTDYLNNGLEMRLPTAEEMAQVYDMDCIRKEGNHYVTIVGCMHRTLKPGEYIWVDKVTGEIIFAGDCTNRIRGVHKAPPCDLIVFETRRPGEIRTHNPIWNPVRDETCYGERDVTFTSGIFNFVTPVRDFSPGCMDRMLGCNYNAAINYVGKRNDIDVTIDNLTPALHAVLVPRSASTNPNFKFGICLEYVDTTTGRRISTSYTVVVRNIDFKMMPNGQRVAFVHYKRSDVPAGLRINGTQMDPGSQFFWEN